MGKNGWILYIELASTGKLNQQTQLGGSFLHPNIDMTIQEMGLHDCTGILCGCFDQLGAY
jgi:hypothetical protein